MKKEVVYSLLAATALTPGIAHADAVVTVSPAATNADLNEGIYTSTGTDVSLSLGTLVPGTYKLSISNINASAGAVTVSVLKESKTTSVGDAQTVELEFTLDKEAEVSVSVKGVSGFTFATPKLSLVATEALKANVQKIQDAINNANSAINGWKTNGFTAATAKEYLDKLTTVTNSLNGVLNDSETKNAGYNYYKDNELYKDVPNDHKLITYANEQEASAAVAYEGQITKLLTDNVTDNAESNYNKAKTEFNSSPSEIKTKYEADLTAIEAQVTTYKESVNSKGSIESDYQPKIDKINSDAGNLLTNLQSAVSGNDKAFNTIDASIKAGQTKAGTYLTDLANGLVEANLEKSGKSNGYDKLRKAGEAAISADVAAYNKITSDNKAYHEAGTAADHQTELTSAITAANKKASDDKTKYLETLRGKLDVANTTYESQYEVLTTAKTDYKDVIDNYKDELTALESAVQKVYDKIDAANAEPYTALAAGLNLDEEVQAVTAAKKALDEAAGASQAKATAVQEALATAGSLRTSLNTEQKDVSTYKYGDDVAETKYWKTWANSIEQKIKDFETTINTDATDAKKDASSIASTESEQKSTIEALITSYKDDSKAAADNYNVVYPRYKKAADDLATAKAKVEKLAIYTDATRNKGGYNYKTKVEGAEAILNTFKGKLEAALAKADAENATDVKGLTFTEDDASAVKAVTDYINANYEADLASYNQYQAETKLAATKATAATAYAELNAKKAKVDTDALNAAEADRLNDGNLGKATEGLKAEWDKIAFPTEDEANKAAAATTSNASIVTEFQSKIDAANDAYDAFKTQYDAAINSVKANNTAKDEVNAQLSTIKDLATNTAAIKKAAPNAYDEAKGVQTPKNEKTKIDEAIKAISDQYTTVDNAVSKAYNAETLPTEYDNTIKAQITAIGTAVAKAIKDAGDLEANYNEWIAEKNARQDVVDLINTTRNSVSTNEDKYGTAGASYYGKTLLGDDPAGTYTVEANSILEAINTNYQKTTAVENKDAITGTNGSIAQLTTKVNAILGDAEANNTSYKNLNTAEKDARDYWTQKSTELAGAVETSTLPETQESMANLLVSISNQASKDKAAFESGTAKVNEANYKKAYSDIKTEITRLVTAATDSKTVNAQILKDNETMRDSVENVMKAAKEDLNNAVARVNTVQNLASSIKDNEGLKTALATANSTLKPYTTSIDAKWTEILADYDKDNEAYEFFNKNDADSYLADYAADTTAIQKAVKDLNDAITTAFGEVTTAMTSYGSALGTAATEVAGKTESTVDDVKKLDAFKKLDDKINRINKAITDADIETVDNEYKDFGEDDFNANVDAAKETVVKAYLDGIITAADRDITEGKAYLAKNDPDKVEAYNADIENVTKARQALSDTKGVIADDYTDYNTIKGYIDAYNTDNAYKSAVNDAEWQTTRLALIQTQQGKVDAAEEVINKYAAAEAIKASTNGINDLNAELAQYKGEANEMIKTTSATDVEAVGSAADILKSEKIGSTIYTQELTYLNARITDLTAAYNVWATTSDASEAEIASEKEAVDQLSTDINSTEKITDATKFLDYETTIKEKLAKYLKSDAATVNAAKDDLVKALGEVATDFAEGTHDEVKPEFQQQLDAIKAESESISNEINSAGDNIVFQKDAISTKISNIKTKADDLAEAVKEANEAYDTKVKANEAAGTTLKNKVKDLNDAIADSKAKLDKYTFNAAKSAKYQSKYDKIQAQVDDAEQKVEAAIAQLRAVAFEEADSVSILTPDVESTIKGIENAAAYQQALADFGTLSKSFNALKDKVNGLHEAVFLAADLNNIKKQTTTIESSITTLSTTISNAYSTNATLGDGWYYTEATPSEDGTPAKPASGVKVQIEQLNKNIKDVYGLIKDNVILAPGDINADGEVGTADLDKLVNNFGKTVTDQDDIWNIEEGHVIDISDIQTVVKAINGDK